MGILPLTAQPSPALVSLLISNCQPKSMREASPLTATCGSEWKSKSLLPMKERTFETWPPQGDQRNEWGSPLCFLREVYFSLGQIRQQSALGPSVFHVLFSGDLGWSQVHM